VKVRPREVVPPLLLGMGAVVSAEMALGLLLYSADGFFPALTLALVIELAALTAGLANRPESPQAPRTWRWMIAAIGLLVAAAAALFWSVAGEMPDSVLSRGGALALFAALPMYGFGLIFAGLRTHLRGDDGRRWPGRARPVGGSILLGATLGVLAFGELLLPRFTPFSIYLFSLLCVATAAMIEGARHERARRAYLAIPSIAEFAPDSAVPAQEEESESGARAR